jgi:hypothetical protein
MRTSAPELPTPYTTVRFTAYLMGNHVTQDDGPVLLTAEVPSLQLGSYGDPRILEVVEELDREPAALLALLGATVPDVLAGGAR